MGNACLYQGVVFSTGHRGRNQRVVCFFVAVVSRLLKLRLVFGGFVVSRCPVSLRIYFQIKVGIREIRTVLTTYYSECFQLAW